MDGAQPVEPAVLFLLGSGVLHFGGGGAGPGGENEGEQAVVVHLLDEGHGFLEFLLRLPGEAHNHVAGQHKVRHHGFGVVYFLQIGFPVIVPVHGLQHPAGAGLEGQVELLGNFRVARHGVKELG